MELIKLFDMRTSLRIDNSSTKTPDDDKKNLPEVFFRIGQHYPAYTY